MEKRVTFTTSDTNESSEMHSSQREMLESQSSSMTSPPSRTGSGVFYASTMSLFKPVWVLCHESMVDLAKNIVSQCIKLEKESTLIDGTAKKEGTRTIEFKPICRWDKFADGFPNLFIDNVKELAGKDVVFVGSMHNVEVIFEQVSMLYALPRYLAHSCTVILPYFPTGTMERIDLEGQVPTAMTLATILSAIPMTSRGPTQLMFFDIHALQERHYFGNSVIPRLETAIPLVLEIIASNKKYNWAIAFPDDGAEKRFSHHFPTEFERIVCNKIRDGNKRIVKIKEGDVMNKDVLIVDDLVQSGGTLIEAAKVLHEAGASSVSAYVTHAVFPGESWRKFVTSDDKPAIVQNFWITDSMPHSRQIAEHSPFHLLSLASVVAKSLLGYDLRQFH